MGSRDSSEANAVPKKGNRSQGGTGTGPFFGELICLATYTLAENTDLSPSLPPRERLPKKEEYARSRAARPKGDR